MHDRGSSLVQPLQQFHDLLTLAPVEAAGRLIGQDDARLGDDCTGNRHLLLLATRELRRIEVLLADDLKPVENLSDARLAFLARYVAIRQRYVEVLVDRQVVEQVKLLEYEADVLLVQRVALLHVHLVNGLLAHRKKGRWSNTQENAFVLLALDRYFNVKPVQNPDHMQEIIAGKKWTFGIIFQDNAFQISLKPDAHREMRWNFPAAIKALDLTILHYFVIQEILGIDGQDQADSESIEYERSFAACLNKVLQGNCQLALITNEVSIADVKTVCGSGCTLPQKSTFFWPKVVCGFVFSSL